MDSPSRYLCQGFVVHGSREGCCFLFVGCSRTQSLCCSRLPDKIEVPHSLEMCCMAIPGLDLDLQ